MNPQKTHMINNITLIIIDQARADYLRFLPECSKLLPYSATVDTNSIPTSTEAMHTNISTGKYPKNHGFISKETKNGEGGLQQIVEKIESKEMSSLALMGVEHGFEVCVIGGKEETVRVMGSPENCSLLVYYSKDDKKFIFAGNDRLLINLAEPAAPPIFDFKTQNTKLDFMLFEMFNQACLKKGRSFNILTLPSLDYIGHKFGPKSPQIEEHMAYLDKTISSTIRQFPDNASFIIVGDHGCRKTDRYLIPMGERDFRQVAVYLREEDCFMFKGWYNLDAEHNFEKAHYNGGILRIWMKKGINHLSKNDVSFLSTYGKIYNLHQLKNLPDKNLKELLKNSRHKNLGDIIVDSFSDVTFCKFGWVRGAVDKIKMGADLAHGELPYGEHGTSHLEDREVLCISNYGFGSNKMCNIQLNEYIKKIMQSNK